MALGNGDTISAHSVSPVVSAVIPARDPPRRHRYISNTLVSLLIAMVMIAAGAWSVFLAILNAAPNTVVNDLMNTTQFDDGDFWQLAEATTSIRATSVVSLGFIAAAYIALGMWIIVKLLASLALAGKTISPQNRRVALQKAPPTFSIVSWLNAHPNRRKRWNLFLEIVEIILQLVTLRELLEEGHQVPIVTGYVTLMAVNSCTCFYFIVISWKGQDLHHEVVADAILDLCFAVGFPAAQTIYAIRNFRGDLTSIAIRQKYFPPKPFERKARLFVDPVQIAIFSTTLASLRMETVREVFVRLAFNVFACTRWFRIVRRWLSTTKNKRGHNTQPKPGVVAVPTRAIPSFVGYMFLVFGVSIVLYTKEAIHVSASDCVGFPAYCPLNAHRWIPGASSSVCACLVFISQGLQRSLFDDESPDIIANLSALAEAGTLRTIQIVNNAIMLPLPENVGGCSNLRHLILINAAVVTLPDWANTAFPRLEYLHIESASIGPHLASLSSDLFRHMFSLRTLVLVNQDQLLSLPPMEHLASLKTLYLEKSMSLVELPSLSAATKLQNLVLLSIRNLVRLPDWSNKAPMNMVYIQAAALCCNGFLANGAANISVFPCSMLCPGLCFGDNETANWSLPSTDKLRALQPFVALKTVCDPSYKVDFRSEQQRVIIPCRLFSQCRGGICYSPGFDSPTCMKDPMIIDMRKEMIRNGAKCDPVDEAWLGCV